MANVRRTDEVRMVDINGVPQQLMFHAGFVITKNDAGKFEGRAINPDNTFTPLIMTFETQAQAEDATGDAMMTIAASLVDSARIFTELQERLGRRRQPAAPAIPTDMVN